MEDPKLEELKANWLRDPIWDIEDTAGFEAHYQELLVFRLRHEKKLDEEMDARDLVMANKRGLTVEDYREVVRLRAKAGASKGRAGGLLVHYLLDIEGGDHTWDNGDEVRGIVSLIIDAAMNEVKALLIELSYE